jgi:hypothetical protein
MVFGFMPILKLKIDVSDTVAGTTVEERPFQGRVTIAIRIGL